MKQNWKHLHFYVADSEKPYMAKGQLFFCSFVPHGETKTKTKGWELKKWRKGGRERETETHREKDIEEILISLLSSLLGLLKVH